MRRSGMDVSVGMGPAEISGVSSRARDEDWTTFWPTASPFPGSTLSFASMIFKTTSGVARPVEERYPPAGRGGPMR